MNLKELIDTQKSFDETHGWSVDSNDNKALIQTISDDIVGLVGELGEFANLIKKGKLVHENPEELNNFFEKNKEDLHTEIIDMFIYLVRISSHLDVDLENIYSQKLEKNRVKYKPFEIGSD